MINPINGIAATNIQAAFLPSDPKSRLDAIYTAIMVIRIKSKQISRNNIRGLKTSAFQTFDNVKNSFHIIITMVIVKDHFGGPFRVKSWAPTIMF